MLEKLIQKVTGKDCELQERMLRTIILVGGMAVLIAITEIKGIFSPKGAETS